MPKLHICNTFFEKELETPEQKPLLQWFRSHPVVQQLQFLPLLYAAPEDKILVSDLPENPDPRLCLIDHPPTGYPIEHWGPSRAIAAWAEKHRLPYSIPDWPLVRQVNSKVFSFTAAPQLPGSALLRSHTEVTAWMAKTPGPTVLKTPFGTAGKGHILNDKASPKQANVKPQYKTPTDEASFGGPEKANVKPLYICPLIGEPWVERALDFSTQWEKGELIGVTVFENEPNGTYKGTFEGVMEPWALEEHLAVARPLIKKIGEMGYQGNIGVDAFVYMWEGKKRVHPVVEINARKTMSWVALQLPRKRLYYTKEAQGLLPSRLCGKIFKRNITCTC